MMKIYYIVFALFVFSSCKKSGVAIDNGCISEIKRQSFGVTAADSIAAVQLLTQNHLPTNDLQFEYIRLHDTVTTNGTTNVYQYIFAVEYLNGLPVLSYDFGYTFKNNVFQQVTGARYDAITLNTHSTQSLPRLRELYMTEVSKNGTTIVNFKDSCVVAQFGYYDMNVDFNVLTNDHTPNFVKAWSVKPKHAWYPQVIFRDDDGKTIIYNTGPVLLNQ
ncbi:hypothetical protein [Mucilaginibacter sp. BT774]|uniref:hypothetical protein n=1 Tax=Mucilaginibacter sp. BT774 TaxID=3062276 RepID=UPI002676ED56|nr:hypothetical protein [Mucilaginibacter sp. BT774]MDO3626700.1 hypothetical protein [Mucilaginibacter sp. BT774]